MQWLGARFGDAVGGHWRRWTLPRPLILRIPAKQVASSSCVARAFLFEHKPKSFRLLIDDLPLSLLSQGNHSNTST